MGLSERYVFRIHKVKQSTRVTLVSASILVALCSLSVVNVNALRTNTPSGNRISASKCSRVGTTRIISGVKHSCIRSKGGMSWKPVSNSPKSSVPSSSTAPAVTVPLKTDNLVLATNCRITDPNPTEPLSLGFQKNRFRLKSQGEVRIGVVFTDFPDAVATSTTQKVFEIVSPGAEKRYEHLSYGRLKFTLVPYHGWIRMSKNSTEYRMSRKTVADGSHLSYIDEALSKGGDAFIDGSVDGFLVLTNPKARAFDFGPAFLAYPVGGTPWSSRFQLLNGATSGIDLLEGESEWVNHEFGHTMGLVDLYAYQTTSDPSSMNRYVGWYSVMGSHPFYEAAPELFGWERWSLGWINDDQIACLTKGTATVDIDPIERPGGTKILVVPVGRTRAIVVESRRNLGYDKGLKKEGALVYVVDLSLKSGYGVIQVLPLNEQDASKMSVALLPGESLEFEGVRVTSESKSSAGDRVTVSYGG